MTDQQKVQLLPCPFCGGQPMRGSSYDEDVLLHNIRCRCGAGVNDFFGPEEAIDAWNTRQSALAHASSATVKENLTVGVMTPRAWLHVMHREDGSTDERLSMSKKNPFGTPGVDYDRSYKVTSEPLHTHPTPSAEDALSRIHVLCNQWAQDAKEHLNTFGQHLPASIDCLVEQLKAALGRSDAMTQR